MTENERKSEVIPAEDDDSKMKRRVSFHNRCLSNISSAGLTVTPPMNVSTPSSPVMQVGGASSGASPMATDMGGDENGAAAAYGCQCKCRKFERHHWKPICKYCSHAESFHDADGVCHQIVGPEGTRGGQGSPMMGYCGGQDVPPPAALDNLRGDEGGAPGQVPTLTQQQHIRLIPNMKHGRSLSKTSQKLSPSPTQRAISPRGPPPPVGNVVTTTIPAVTKGSSKGGVSPSLPLVNPAAAAAAASSSSSSSTTTSVKQSHRSRRRSSVEIPPPPPPSAQDEKGATVTVPAEEKKKRKHRKSSHSPDPAALRVSERSRRLSTDILPPPPPPATGGRDSLRTSSSSPPPPPPPSGVLEISDSVESLDPQDIEVPIGHKAPARNTILLSPSNSPAITATAATAAGAGQLPKLSKATTPPPQLPLASPASSSASSISGSAAVAGAGASMSSNALTGSGASPAEEVVIPFSEAKGALRSKRMSLPLSSSCGSGSSSSSDLTASGRSRKLMRSKIYTKSTLSQIVSNDIPPPGASSVAGSSASSLALGASVDAGAHSREPSCGAGLAGSGMDDSSEGSVGPGEFEGRMVEISEEELECLYDIEDSLTNFITDPDNPDDSNEPPVRPLGKTFYSIMAAAVSLLEMSNTKYVREFMDALKVSLSANPRFTGVAPLNPVQLRNLKLIGRNAYALFRQQDLIEALSETQAIITSNVFSRLHRDNKIWLAPPFSTWFDFVKSLYVYEKQVYGRLLSTTYSSNTMNEIFNTQNELVTALSAVCNNYPLSTCWNVGEAYRVWFRKLRFLSPLLQTEVVAAPNRSFGKGVAPLLARSARVIANLKTLKDLYAPLLAIEDLTSAEKDAIRADLAGLDATIQGLPHIDVKTGEVNIPPPPPSDKLSSSSSSSSTTSPIPPPIPPPIDNYIPPPPSSLSTPGASTSYIPPPPPGGAGYIPPPPPSSPGGTGTGAGAGAPGAAFIPPPPLPGIKVVKPLGGDDNEEEDGGAASIKHSHRKNHKSFTASSQRPEPSSSPMDISTGSKRHKSKSARVIDTEVDVDGGDGDGGDAKGEAAEVEAAPAPAPAPAPAKVEKPKTLPPNRLREKITDGTLDTIDGKTHAYELYNDYIVVKTEPDPLMISLKEAFIRSVTENTFELYHGSEVFITIMRTKPKCKSNLETLLHGVIAKLRVFGVYLEDLIATESNNNGTNIPEIADTFMEFIEEHGFNCEGIFRLSGKASVMAALKEALDNRSKDIDFSSVSAYDVAHLFKRFLIELPEPILTTEGYKKFMALRVPRNVVKDSSKDLDGMDPVEIDDLCTEIKAIIDKLPVVYRDFSRAVFAFLLTCTENSKKNKMGPNNLAIVMAPSILRSSSPDPNHMDMDAMTKANKLVAFMIENCFTIFY